MSEMARMDEGVLSRLLSRYTDLQSCEVQIEYAFQLLRDTFRTGHKLLVCGNGGSAADSEHIVGELMKGFLRPRSIPDAVQAMLIETCGEDGRYLAHHLQGGLPAISLVSQFGLFTAFVNDVAADMVFAQQVYGYGQPGDVLWGISTSGNSPNVLYAAQIARSLGLRTVGLTGADGGKLANWCDVLIRVPYTMVPEVQERHLPIYHALCAALELEFFSP